MAATVIVTRSLQLTLLEVRQMGLLLPTSSFPQGVSYHRRVLREFFQPVIWKVGSMPFEHAAELTKASTQPYFLSKQNFLCNMQTS